VARLLLSIGVSLILLTLLLRLPFGGADARLQYRFFDVLKRVAPSGLLFYLAFALIQALFRAIRYRVLIRAGGEAAVPSLFHTYLVTLIRNMLVDLLPARVGELGYVAMMNRGYRVSGKTCVSSLGISFLFDLIALMLLLGAIAAVQIFISDLPGWLLSTMLVLTLAVALMSAAIFFGLKPLLACGRRVVGKGGRAPVFRRLLAFLEELDGAVDQTKRSGQLGVVLLLSLAVRGAKYTGLYFLFRAVAGPSFPELAGVGPHNVLHALVAAEASASLPVPSFMSFGTYEAGGLLALTLLGFPAIASRLTMLVMHVWSQCMDYTLGGAGFVVFLFRSRAVSFVPRQPAPRRRVPLAVLAAGLVLIGGSAAFLLQYRGVKKLGALRAPVKGQPVSAPDLEAGRRAETAKSLDGFVVWSSNRYGQHDVLMLSFPHLGLRRLTEHPHVDTFPRVSPDGSRIAFARSKEPWVSQRNQELWDVRVLDLHSGRDALVAENANAPSWSPCGTKLCFQRNGTSLVEHTLADGTERVLFEAGVAPVPKGVTLHMAGYGYQHGAMAATLRGARRATVVAFTGGEFVEMGGGCQLAWAADESFLYRVAHEGKQGTAFQRLDPQTWTSSRWLDLPGAYSHEYFPRLSKNGACLVFGASTGGHEHDTADYEIFLWDVALDADAAVRLTFHTGNDCWPDLHLR